MSPHRRPSPPIRRRSAKLGLEALEDRFLPSGGPLTSAILNLPGFASHQMMRADDASTSNVDIGFSINFLGKTYSKLTINTNGNITFDKPLATYTPFDLTTTQKAIIAPFFADVDTRNPLSGVITYGNDSIDGYKAFAVTWTNVGYFNSHADRTDTFQVVFINRSDTGVGNFDLEFNYGQIQWEAGDASFGRDGLGGFAARVGFSNGSGAPGTFFQLQGSGTPGAFLDSSLNTGLVHLVQASNPAGQVVFAERGGKTILNQPPVITPVVNQTVTEGGTLSFSITATDPDLGEHLTYSLVGSVPSGATIDPVTGVFTYTPTQAPATNTFTVRVTDNGIPALSSETNFQVIVANQAPTVTVGIDALVSSGTTFTRQGLFTDPGPGTFTAQVDYGDGLGFQNLTLQSDHTFLLSHEYTGEGTFTITVRVSDGTDTGSASLNVVVLASASKVTQFQSADILPGETKNLTLNDPLMGRSGTLTVTRSSSSPTDGSVAFAFYNSNPTNIPKNGEFFDIQLQNPTPDDQITLTYHTGLSGASFDVGFIDPKTGKLTAVPATITFDPKTGNLTIVFKTSSIFGHTVFAVSLAQAVTTSTPVNGPVVLGPSSSNSSDIPLDLRTSVSFTSRTQLTLTLSTAQEDQLKLADSSALNGSLASTAAAFREGTITGGGYADDGDGQALLQYYGDEGTLWWGVEMKKRAAARRQKAGQAPAANPVAQPANAGTLAPAPAKQTNPDAEQSKLDESNLDNLPADDVTTPVFNRAFVLTDGQQEEDEQEFNPLALTGLVLPLLGCPTRIEQSRRKVASRTFWSSLLPE